MSNRSICDIEDGRHKPSARFPWLDFVSLSLPSLAIPTGTARHRTEEMTVTWQVVR